MLLVGLECVIAGQVCTKTSMVEFVLKNCFQRIYIFERRDEKEGVRISVANTK